MNRHQSARNRALAGEVGRFVDAVRAWDTPTITYVLLPDGTEHGKRFDYGGWHVVHSGQMGSVEDYIQREAKRDKR